MYICSCKGITDQHLRDLISAKPSASPKEICKSLGVASDCGSCLESAIEVIQTQSLHQFHHQNLIQEKK